MGAFEESMFRESRREVREARKGSEEETNSGRGSPLTGQTGTDLAALFRDVFCFLLQRVFCSR